jgi:Na+-transporting NADH:ubiquinone oxidoreductase subunit C
MVVIVAAVLSTAATVLKPLQEQNVRNEKMSSILASANIESTAENAEELYNKYIVQEIVVDSKGAIMGTYENGKLDGSARAFDVKIKTEQFKQKNGDPFVSPLYVCKKDNETFYIIPMLGKGLWGPIWGNIALKDDFNTVVGVIFDHKG